MSLYTLDTDTLSLYQHGLPGLVSKVDAHLPHELAITVVTVEEQLTGWYSLLRKVHGPDEEVRAYKRLAEAIPQLARWQILSLSRSALLQYETLKRMNLNVRKMDLRIAAIVLECNGVVVTRNVRDFQRFPNLAVENWVS
jgi:tRNA(fMet)-specific endonuclease VapC